MLDRGPILRSHPVRTLEDRVLLLRRLAWFGEAAFGHGDPVGGLQDPRMRQLGLAITSVCRARNDMCELGAIHEFVTMPGPDGRPNVRYTGDITDKDTFQSALRTLQYRGGDCDDQAILTSVLAMENGYQTKFRITSNNGDTWDHIYTMAGVPKHAPRRWVAIDTTLGRSRFNVEPPRAKYRDFPVAEPRR